ncbi:MAG: FMN-binding protein [Acidobacteria bacterium]|nr:FMN-binding protein [Acidobacteriota bacterium]
MRTLLAVVFAVATLSVAFAADRIFTNPKPDAHLKKLFPQAAAFSPLQGTPLHFKAYAADPKANPNAPLLGYAFWTTDIVPNERGYHAAIHFLVGLDLKGVITGVVLDYDSEPYGYFSIQPPEFVAQFKGKSVRAPFRLGEDIDAVSRATITMSSAVRAIRDSSRTMARQFLDPAAVKP